MIRCIIILEISISNWKFARFFFIRFLHFLNVSIVICSVCLLHVFVVIVVVIVFTAFFLSFSKCRPSKIWCHMILVDWCFYCHLFYFNFIHSISSFRLITKFLTEWYYKKAKTNTHTSRSKFMGDCWTLNFSFFSLSEK